jgi:hypothetical protein
MKLLMPLLALILAANVAAQAPNTNPSVVTPSLSTSLNSGSSVGEATSNLPPVAIDDEYHVVSGELVSVPAPGVLANDSGYALLSMLPGNGTGQGTLELMKDGGFNYQSLPGFAGEDVFTYQVMDANGVTATAQIHFYCGEVPPAPLEIALSGSSLDPGKGGGSVEEAASCSVAVGFAPWLLVSLVGLASVRIRRARA